MGEELTPIEKLVLACDRILRAIKEGKYTEVEDIKEEESPLFVIKKGPFELKRYKNSVHIFIKGDYIRELTKKYEKDRLEAIKELAFGILEIMNELRLKEKGMI